MAPGSGTLLFLLKTSFPSIRQAKKARNNNMPSQLFRGEDNPFFSALETGAPVSARGNRICFLMLG